MIKTICVVTGGRGDYWLLRPLLSEIASDPDLKLQLAVTGSHLMPEHGHTVDAILADGFEPDERIDLKLRSDNEIEVAKAMGRGVIGFAEAFGRLRPDLAVVLGDRYEILAAAQAAFMLRIPIAHISGGEVTAGVLDDAIRHAVTKLSHLHFPAAEPYRQRIIRMGEDPTRVFNVGEIGLETLKGNVPLPQGEVQKRLGLQICEPLFLVTYHPETLHLESVRQDYASLLAALDRQVGASIIITRANADASGNVINRMSEDFATARPGRVGIYSALGAELYHSVMRLATAVVGNSSSGIVEAPSLGIPTINVGDRQKGRLRATSIIDVPADEHALDRAFARVREPWFRKAAQSAINPYGGSGTCAQVKDILKGAKLSAASKVFDDQEDYHG